MHERNRRPVLTRSSPVLIEVLESGASRMYRIIPPGEALHKQAGPSFHLPLATRFRLC